MLILFLILFFPIKLRAKALFIPEEGYFSARLFLLRIFLFNFTVIVHNKALFYKIGAFKPKRIDELSLSSAPFKQKSPFLIQRLDITLKMGGDPIFVTLITAILDNLKAPIAKAPKAFHLEIKPIPQYFSDTLKSKIEIRLLTSVFIALFSLIYNLISKINYKKEKSNAVQQPN